MRALQLVLIFAFIASVDQPIRSRREVSQSNLLARVYVGPLDMDLYQDIKVQGPGSQALTPALRCLSEYAYHSELPSQT
jgi:hypothetical protein